MNDFEPLSAGQLLLRAGGYPTGLRFNCPIPPGGLPEHRASEHCLGC
jgi:hypothetical protein